MAILSMALFTAYSSDNDNSKTIEAQKLPQINNVSLNYHSSEQNASLLEMWQQKEQR